MAQHVGEGGEVVGQVGAVGRFNGDTLADDWFRHWGLSIKTNEQQLLVMTKYYRLFASRKEEIKSDLEKKVKQNLNPKKEKCEDITKVPSFINRK